jgi:transcriptional regulator GlxA family with amidase domain
VIRKRATKAASPRAAATKMSAPRTIAMLIFDDAQSLDITGPLEVFALASRQARENDARVGDLYVLKLIATRRTPVTMASGLRLVPDWLTTEMPRNVDTLFVSGGMNTALDSVRADTTLVGWLRDAAKCVRRIASICNGSLLLAHAGVLDDREATSHWRDIAELQQRYPKVRVVRDAIYTQDDSVWTSAGITAGMDLALAMVAADHGMPLALQVAKRMVMVSKRSGGQSQYSPLLHALDDSDPIARLTGWIAANLRARLDVEKLAQRVHMSPRQFTRRIRDALDTTPQKLVEQLRIDAAKPLLESTQKDLKRIAAECGFASAEAMRRAFVRHLGVKPLDYRQRFGVP